MNVHCRRNFWRHLLLVVVGAMGWICLAVVFSSNARVENMEIKFTNDSARVQDYLISPSGMDARLERIHNVCKEWSVPGKVSIITVYPPRHTAYCINHKVASTYWLQVFRYLYNDTTRDVHRPSDISKFETHLSQFRYVEFLNFYNLTIQRDLTRNYFRFMITREPYKRLWSVYIDKFVLVDGWFWDLFAPEIRTRYLATFGNGETLENTKCLKDISFKEFIHYVSEIGSKSPENLNDHMIPVHYTCNPCHYKPTFVGNLETMTDEKPIILDRLGLSRIDSATNFTDHVLNEITTIADFEFDSVLAHKYQRRCLTDAELETRIIRAFVFNGYFREDVFTEVEQLLPLGRDRFVPVLMEIFTNSNITPSESSSLRKRFMLEAYSHIPLSMLKNLKITYTFDFLLFGYNPEPPDIFAHTKTDST
ncbi:carbohydrate sulfotransferase 11 [Aplysia californica]|uniref:Carbohydrate sulfotransferase n=1 Tax=Aplysia californica TaxID=6500 RepID=A0ABM0JI86_APLCA|nr:carbohydrate sulfotransferase 11 [Aplysia californica]